MTQPCTAAFIINLLQDVNILRPLIVMASRHFGFETRLLISSRFIGRDQSGIWQAELRAICDEAGATQSVFNEPLEVFQWLNERAGLIFAASESDLSTHAVSHEIFRSAPKSMLRVTLQHGFECVGFRHSGDHARAYGQTVSFGADIICAWYGPSLLSAMAPSQRRKLYVTGSTALLQQPRGLYSRPSDAPGLVCENLHSVRLNIAGDFKSEFVDAFEGFCGALAKEKRSVVLRPHPGGQYVIKNNITLPKNAVINNAPMYQLDLRQFSYGISAPSSVLIDMLLAGIPTGVWRDTSGIMDASAYDGLTVVSSPAEWLEFTREAIAHPEIFAERQQRFLDGLDMPLDPDTIYANFADIFVTARGRVRNVVINPVGKDRLLFVANDYIPTLQLSFIKPLSPLVGEERIDLEVLTERTLREKQKANPALDIGQWLSEELDRINPTTIIFCRYSGPYYDVVLDWALERGVPVIYHVDDDLLNIPPELGDEKHAFHNAPARLTSVRTCLQRSDLVYCSTPKLRARLSGPAGHDRLMHGGIYCSASVIREAEERPIHKIGYMGFDHAHDLELALPALVHFLRSNNDISFELFGSIPKPAALDEFGKRVVTIPPVRDYAEFLRVFADRNWDIGICPLAKTEFNMVKANTKWVEYTASGIAVIASRGTVYDECCRDGAGILAETEQDWIDALEYLSSDAGVRFTQVVRAQDRLRREYSPEKLKDQVLSVIFEARNVANVRFSHKVEEVS